MKNVEIQFSVMVVQQHNYDLKVVTYKAVLIMYICRGVHKAQSTVK